MKNQFNPGELRRDRESLLTFLGECRRLASQRAHAQLASITLKVGPMDPLAVWEAIYDLEEHHFYFEEPQENLAIASIGAVISVKASGEGRFRQIREWTEEWKKNSLSIGDLHQPFSGPHFFGGFTFEEELVIKEPFAPATAFVPRWQVSVCQGEYTAVANSWVDVDTDIEILAERILAAHKKFYSFDYRQGPNGRAQQAKHRRPHFEEEGEKKRLYEESVGKALQRIDKGDLEKIVLARAQSMETDHPFFPPLLLDRLRKRYAACRIFSLGLPGGVAFIGASPERLVRIHQGKLFTEAIAGSIPASESAREDHLLGERLLTSEKDLREHQFVVESLLQALKSKGLTPVHASTPKLLKLSNVQHLWTPIHAEVSAGDSILNWVERFQPTPAVGGNPKPLALELIRQWETDPRGLYCGSVGWWNVQGEGEFVVGIRSALIQKNRAALWAGAGIVTGSLPDREWRETGVKLNAMREVFEKPFERSEWE